MFPVFGSVESARKIKCVVVVGYNQVHHTIKARQSFFSIFFGKGWMDLVI